MATDWKIDWYVCRANLADEAFNRAERKAKREKRVIKAGDELWRVPQSIGPITTDHSHWGGTHIALSPKQAEFVAAACAAYEATGNAWPEGES